MIDVVGLIVAAVLIIIGAFRFGAVWEHSRQFANWEKWQRAFFELHDIELHDK